MTTEKAKSIARGWLGGRALGIRYDTVAAVLRACGWHETSRGGSHRTWWKEGVREHVTLVDRGTGPMLPVYVKRAAKVVLREGGTP